MATHTAHSETVLPDNAAAGNLPVLVKAPHLPPDRGLLFTHNLHGQALSPTDLQKWLRLLAVKYKVRKADLRVTGDGCARVPALLSHAEAQELGLSVRVSGDIPASLAAPHLSSALLDLFLCPATLDLGYLESWLTLAAELELPLRLQLPLPLPDTMEPAELSACLARFQAVLFRFEDPFEAYPRHRASAAIADDLASLWPVVEALTEKGVPVRVGDVPFCQVDPAWWHTLQNGSQAILDGLHYQTGALDTAARFFPVKPANIAKALDVETRNDMSFHNLVDQAVLPYILNHNRLFFRLWFFHKLTRHLKFVQRDRPRPLPEDVTSLESMVEAHRQKAQSSLGPACAACRFQQVCDHVGDGVRARYGAVTRSAISGPQERNPFFALSRQPAYLDALDRQRLAEDEKLQALALEARRILAELPPTREIGADAYGIEDHMVHRMPSSIRWFSFTNAELQSTELPELRPPFTLALTFGGGIAEHIGFSFGRYARIMVPMIDAQHRLVLHADEQGNFVMLRDDEVVRPIEYRYADLVPRRLAGANRPRICINNIDGEIVTQTLLMWENSSLAPASAHVPRHSVIVVSTRYSRRLQAVLQGLIHQTGIDFRDLEIIVVYVPGLDATDDILDSLALTRPELRIVRLPVAKGRAKAKGFMLNEAMALAHAERITLVDSDIILPPDFFVRLDAYPDAIFVAPDGRRMLSPETTAAILLGDIKPWECYEALAEGGGEYRHHESDGMPPGFCQCVNRKVLEKVTYAEMDHFEGCDWLFSNLIIEAYGDVQRLEGMKLLHLDHGGSQWYGASKHM